jgi:hypothetical protein
VTERTEVDVDGEVAVLVGGSAIALVGIVRRPSPLDVRAGLLRAFAGARVWLGVEL